MKKILFKSFGVNIGGIERVQISYINYLVKNNYDVKVLIDNDFGNTNAFDKDINTTIIYLKSYNELYNFSKIYFNAKNAANRQSDGRPRFLL